MQAFHNKSQIKASRIARVKRHAALDQIVKGKYWENGKGCAVGCTVHSGNHSAYETEMGIPRVLARLEDAIFERLPNELAMTWPLRFLEAVKVGTDLSGVWNKFAAWLVRDVVRFTTNEKSIDTIVGIADLYDRVVASGDSAVSSDEWRKAKNDAYAAAYAADAAYAAAAAADAAYAAYAADAAYAAYAAAAADAAYAAYAAAKQRYIVTMSEKLLQILKEA